MPNKTKIQRLILGEESYPTLRDIAGLSVEQLTTLAAFADQHGFDAGLVEMLDLAASLQVSHERTLDLLKFLEILDTQRNDFELSAEDVLEEFRTYFKNHSLNEMAAEFTKKEPLISRLFQERPDVKLNAKIRIVSKGLIPTAVSFESLCDLRPVFNDQRDRILQYVSVALIRIRKQSDGRDEPSETVFQIDTDGLRELVKFVEKLQKKFAAIETSRQKLLGGKN